MPQNEPAFTAKTAPDNAYLRCLRGQVPVPASGAERFAFQTLMVFFMVSCMVTFNWLIRNPAPTPDAFAGMLYEYPLTFCIALAVRFCVANPLVDRIAARIPRALSGIGRTLAMTAANVCVMAPIMTFFGTLVSHGPEGFTWSAFALGVPVSIAAAFAVNLLAVGPLAKTLYARTLKPRILSLMRRASTLKSAFAAEGGVR